MVTIFKIFIFNFYYKYIFNLESKQQNFFIILKPIKKKYLIIIHYKILS